MRALAAVACACLAALLQAPQPAPVFRAGTTYVLVDVVAIDDAGRPVTDLRQEDFEIREGARAQDIVDFDYVSVPLNDRAIDLAGAAPPPDVFSNARPPRSARAFAILMHHVRAEEIVRTKRVLHELLRGLHEDDRVAVVYPSRSDLGQDFTKDEGLLIRAVNNVRASIGGGPVPRWDLYFRNVLRSLASAPESRRAVILVSDIGISVSRDRDTLDESRRLNVPIYTIDPRGLMAPQLGLGAHMENQTPEARAALDKAVGLEQDSMRELAINTNGRAYVNRWDPTVAVRELLADNGSYYVLGFYPNPATSDGKFHDIDVRVRRPGVRIRSRAGYQADKPPSPRQKAVPAIVQDLGNGTPGGDLTISATAAPVEARGKRTATLLTFSVPAPEAPLAADERLQFAWIAIDADGGIKASGQNEVRREGSGAASRAPIVVNDLIDLPGKGRLTIRLSVSSDGRGARGVVHVPCDVGAIHDGRVRATPLLLGEQRATGIPHVIGAAVSPVPFQPTTRRTFSRSETLHAFVRLFASSPAGLTGTVTLRRGGAIVATIPAVMSARAMAPSSIDAGADLPLGELRPGAYAMTFTATVPAGASVTRAIPFVVR
jgi:VWFA-related protein